MPQAWSRPENRPLSRRMHREKCRPLVRLASGAPVFANGAVTAAMAYAFNSMSSAGGAQEETAADKRERVAEIALEMEGDTSYAYSEGKGRFPEDSWKCNLFVHDVLERAGIAPPLQPGGPWPLIANSWANPNYEVPGWIIVNDPMPGDVGAIPRSGTGHVGIYIEDRGRLRSNVMAANRDGVGWSGSHMRNDWFNSWANATGDTVYRRYVGQ